jgi:hypothetical protein
VLVLRALAEGRIRWAFWPPETPLADIHVHQPADAGIWIRNPEGEEYDDDGVESGAEEQREHSGEETEGSEDEEDSESEDVDEVKGSVVRFSALTGIPDENEDGEEEDEEDEVVKVTQGRFGALMSGSSDKDEEDSDS